MTPTEYQYIIDAWVKDREYEERASYELSRFNAWLSAPNLKPNTKQEDFCRLPWEKLQVAKITNGKTNSISKT